MLDPWRQRASAIVQLVLEGTDRQYTKIAPECGTTGSAVHNWRAGRRVPSPDRVIRFCRAAGANDDTTRSLIAAYLGTSVRELRDLFA